MALVRDANGNLVDDGRPATGLAAAAYDPNPAVRNAQAAADARQQTLATGGRAAVMQAAPGYDTNPTIRQAQAAQDAAEQARVTGGRAAAMQAQANQPVYGPRNPPPAAPDTRPVLAQGDIGSALYGLGQALTSPQTTDQNAMFRSRFGVAPQAAPATAQSSSAAAAQPAATPAQPAMDPQIAAAFAERDRRRANNAVLEQDRANLRQAGFAPIVGPQPETSLSQDTLAATNQRIQAALDANRAPAQIPGERGNYNLANTSNVDAQGNITTRLRQPDNIIEGGYGQFGGGRAAQFLASRRNTGGGFTVVGEEVSLRNQLTSNDPFERRAARELLASRQALALDAGATERQGMQLEGEQIRASLAGEAAVQAAQATAEGKQYEAQMEGEYGLREAEIGARGTIGAARESANSGSSLKALAEADLITRRANAALRAEMAGDIAARDRLYGVAPPTRRVLTQDFTGDVIAADGYPVSEEEAAAFRRAPRTPPQ